jgi:hypothetical protein
MLPCLTLRLTCVCPCSWATPLDGTCEVTPRMCPQWDNTIWILTHSKQYRVCSLKAKIVTTASACFVPSIRWYLWLVPWSHCITCTTTLTATLQRYCPHRCFSYMLFIANSNAPILWPTLLLRSHAKACYLVWDSLWSPTVTCRSRKILDNQAYILPSISSPVHHSLPSFHEIYVTQAIAKP